MSKFKCDGCRLRELEEKKTDLRFLKLSVLFLSVICALLFGDAINKSQRIDALESAITELAKANSSLFIKHGEGNKQIIKVSENVEAATAKSDNIDNAMMQKVYMMDKRIKSLEKQLKAFRI